MDAQRVGDSFESLGELVSLRRVDKSILQGEIELPVEIVQFLGISVLVGYCTGGGGDP